MEIMFWILVYIVVYFVALYFAVKYTVDKLGARSGLFGGGLVTMFMGFVLHKIVEYTAAVGGYWYNWEGELPILYYLIVFGGLFMGLGGVAMVAVDLLKAVNESRGSAASKYAQSASGTVGSCEKIQPAQQGKIPTWKQIEMEQERQ